MYSVDLEAIYKPSNDLYHDNAALIVTSYYCYKQNGTSLQSLVIFRLIIADVIWFSMDFKNRGIKW